MVAAVMQELRLQAAPHPAHSSALALHKNGSGTIAVLLHQGASLREDRDAIEALKAADKDLPIIYIARNSRPRRETAIRRLCIHYFLAYPVEGEELRLVLDVLVRNSVSAASFERFFTR